MFGATQPYFLLRGSEEDQVALGAHPTAIQGAEHF